MGGILRQVYPDRVPITLLVRTFWQFVTLPIAREGLSQSEASLPFGAGQQRTSAEGSQPIRDLPAI